MTFVSFATYYYFTGNPITIVQAYVTFSFFASFKTPLNTATTFLVGLVQVDNKCLSSIQGYAFYN